jgi:hypothetical protein
MTSSEHERTMATMAEIVTNQEWDRLPEFLHPDAVWEYPQSGEVFRGLANIRGQLEDYPDMEPGTSKLAEVIGDDAYALTPSYTLIRAEGSGLKGTSVIRVRYPDGSEWWVINLYELRDGRISRLRAYFAPDFEAPDWRGPYRDAP